MNVPELMYVCNTQRHEFYANIPMNVYSIMNVVTM